MYRVHCSNIDNEQKRCQVKGWLSKDIKELGKCLFDLGCLAAAVFLEEVEVRPCALTENHLVYPEHSGKLRAVLSTGNKQVPGGFTEVKDKFSKCQW